MFSAAVTARANAFLHSRSSRIEQIWVTLFKSNGNQSQCKEEEGAEETRIAAGQPYVEESLETKPDLFSEAKLTSGKVVPNDGSDKFMTLSDLYRQHKNDSKAKPVKNEGTDSKEPISDVLGGFHRYENAQESKRLIDLLRTHKDDQIASLGEQKGDQIASLEEQKGDQTTSLKEIEGTNLDEAISDVFLEFGKHRITHCEEDGHLKTFPATKCEDNQPECKIARDGQPEMCSSVNRIRKAFDMKDSYIKSSLDKATRKNVKPRSFLFTDLPSEPSNVLCTENSKNHSSVDDLIHSIGLQEDTQSNKSTSYSKLGLREKNPLNSKMQKPQNGNSSNLLDFPAGNSTVQNQVPSTSDFKSTDSKEIKARELSVSTCNKDQNQLRYTLLEKNESEKNKVLVKFLQNRVSKDDIVREFSHCGEILKVEFPRAKGPLYKTAYIYFKMKKGFENALSNSKLVAGCLLMTEPASSMDKKTVKIPIPSLIGDPDIPTALVKNPTRTIKITQLTPEVSSQHVQEALAFCGGNVSGYFLGSSNFVAYVEFETEIAKERALKRHTISVLGRRLVMLRIDTPRTTVVRLFIQSLGLKKVASVCSSLGGVRKVRSRGFHIVDVYFNLAEWPNMMKILNSLNGLNVDGVQLQAEPATVFPPDVLLALWHEPEERKYLKATLQGLVRKFGEPLDLSELAVFIHGFMEKFDPQISERMDAIEE